MPAMSSFWQPPPRTSGSWRNRTDAELPASLKAKWDVRPAAPHKHARSNSITAGLNSTESALGGRDVRGVRESGPRREELHLQLVAKGEAG